MIFLVSLMPVQAWLPLEYALTKLKDFCKVRLGRSLVVTMPPLPSGLVESLLVVVVVVSDM